jgi:hypothetical protein
MRIATVAAAVAAALLLSAAPSGAQSLSELAAKERERRAKAKAGKSYTESDLGKGAPQPAVEAAATDPKAAGAPAAADAAKADPAKKEKTEDELKAERETAWRDKVTKANAEVTRLQARADVLQTALNDLTQNLYGSTRQAQAAELELVQGQLAVARKGLEDLQEEGRRNGYR